MSEGQMVTESLPPPAKKRKVGVTTNKEGEEVDKEGRCPKKKYWLFTWQGGLDGLGFNADSPIWKEVCRYFSMYATHAWMQEEIGPDTGRYHINGFVGFEPAKRFREIEALRQISWCRSTSASEKSNKKYCSKTESAVPGGLFWHKGFPVVTQIKDYPDLWGWQRWVWDLVKHKCEDTRTIYWFYDKEGNNGKTTLVRALMYHMNAFKFSGKTTDVNNRLVNMRNPPNICLINITRSKEEYINYDSLEEVKDACPDTGKYEGGQKLFDSPHVLVFANRLPEFDKLTRDRWVVYELNNREMKLYD